MVMNGAALHAACGYFTEVTKCSLQWN